MSWGYIVPHLKSAQGAQLAKGMTEYKYGLNCAKILDELQGIPWETRDVGGVSGAARRLSKRNVKYSIEDHKNAYNRKVGGFEVLVHRGYPKDAIAAEMLIETFTERLPNLKLRGISGIKWVEGRNRGAGNIRAAHSGGMEIALLTEPFFIDNIDDWIPVDMLADIYLEFFNKAKTAF